MGLEGWAFDLTGTQGEAWLEQAAILQRVLTRYLGGIYLEFTIPRMGRRIDAVVIIGPVVFVLEFKVEEQIFTTQDRDQVVDYALDLHNFQSIDGIKALLTEHPFSALPPSRVTGMQQRLLLPFRPLQVQRGQPGC